MKRVLFALTGLVLFSSALVGCRAGAELDIDEAAPIRLGR